MTNRERRLLTALWVDMKEASTHPSFAIRQCSKEFRYHTHNLELFLKGQRLDSHIEDYARLLKTEGWDGVIEC